MIYPPQLKDGREFDLNWLAGVAFGPLKRAPIGAAQLQPPLPLSPRPAPFGFDKNSLDVTRSLMLFGKSNLGLATSTVEVLLVSLL
jgi:hypothetical protein